MLVVGGSREAARSRAGWGHWFLWVSLGTDSECRGALALPLGSPGCAKDLLCISLGALCRCLRGCATLDAPPKWVRVFPPAFLLVLVLCSARAELRAGLLSTGRSKESSAERVEGGCADSNRTASQGLSPPGCGSGGFVSAWAR